MYSLEISQFSNSNRKTSTKEKMNLRNNKRKDPMPNVDNVVLDDSTSLGSSKTPGTMAQYQASLKKFATFCKFSDFDPKTDIIPQEYFSDENMAKFIHASGTLPYFVVFDLFPYIEDHYQHNPSAKKSILATFNMMLQHHRMENTHIAPHKYPKTIEAVGKWNSYLKVHPHHAESAPILNQEQIAAMLALTCTCPLDYQDKAFCALTTGLGMRKEDVDQIKSTGIQDLPYCFVTKTPRM